MSAIRAKLGLCDSCLTSCSLCCWWAARPWSAGACWGAHSSRCWSPCRCWSQGVPTRRASLGPLRERLTQSAGHNQAPLALRPSAPAPGTPAASETASTDVAAPRTPSAISARPLTPAVDTGAAYPAATPACVPHQSPPSETWISRSVGVGWLRPACKARSRRLASEHPTAITWGPRSTPRSRPAGRTTVQRANSRPGVCPHGQSWGRRSARGNGSRPASRARSANAAFPSPRPTTAETSIRQPGTRTVVKIAALSGPQRPPASDEIGCCLGPAPDLMTR